MLIECGDLVEQEDGSAIMQVELDKEAKEYLINVGLIEMLKKTIKEYKLENPIT